MHRRNNTPVEEIMNHVGSVEQLGDCGVDVLPSLLQSILLVGRLRVINIVEFKILSAIRSVVGEVGVPTLPVLMGEDVITPGNSGIANRRTVTETLVGRVRVIGDRQGVPTQGAGDLVAVLHLNGTFAFTWIVDTPLEDVIGGGTLVLPGNGSVGIGGPVDHRDDLVRRVSRDSSLIPVVHHLNLEFPNQVEVGGVTIRDLDIGETSLDRVDGFGDVVDELYRDVGFTANEVAVHIGRHAVDVLVVLGKDVLNHVVLGGGGDHELKEGVTRVFQLMVLGEELIRKTGERAS